MPTRTRRPSRRRNPEDWFGYSVADDIKVTISSAPITRVRDMSGYQSFAWKPVGLWYACGGAWIEWMESNVPEWIEQGKYLYEVRPKYSVGGLAAGESGDYVGGVLRLSTKEEVVAFSRTYSNFEKVDWYAVSAIWDGIEICPYQYDLRLSMHNWYYPWDVASGCIWRKEGLASPLVLLKSREDATAAPVVASVPDIDVHRRAHGRQNPRRRNPSTLATLALAGVAGAAGYYVGKRALSLPQPPKKVVPLDDDDGYAELRRMQAQRALKQRFDVPFVLPPRKGGPRRNPYPSREEITAASNRVFDALEAEAGEKQVLYAAPFVRVGDRKGGILGELEISVSLRQSDGALSVHLAYIGVESSERQQGRGTRLMQIVTAAASAAGLPMDLEVDPQTEWGDKKPPMNKKQLRDFYKKFGFATVRGMGPDYMERPASRANPRRR